MAKSKSHHGHKKSRSKKSTIIPDFKRRVHDLMEKQAGRSILLRQFLAELLGTFLLVLIGDAAVIQYNVKSKINSNEPFTSVALGYGLALMMGILVAGGVSGAHLNPAVTLTMAVFGKCHWLQLPVYMLAQYLGAFIAAALLYGLYYEMYILNLDEHTFSHSLATYPGDHTLSIWTLVVDQLVGTALLLIIIMAACDRRNMNLSSGQIPLAIGLGLTVIHLGFATNAGAAINPARDFSP